MAKQYTSDWETLIDKCAADEDYRMQLASALEGKEDAPVSRLLDSIGVGGVGDQRKARVNALRNARKPMADVLKTFSDDREFGVAP